MAKPVVNSRVNSYSCAPVVRSSKSLQSKSSQQFNEVKLSWQGLVYEIHQNNAIKTILKTQSGYVTSGTITAVIGPSGAGKSTLLNCLTGRINNFKGDITVATNENHEQNVSIALIPQECDLVECFTVFETVLFASRLKNASNIDHEHLVTELLVSLDLNNARDVKVSKISGGEKKRLSIGIELVSEPNILILDEPTTGLDSNNALLIVRMLKDLAIRRNIAIIATVHQPSSELFNYFDKIYLLSLTGQSLYFGPTYRLIAFLEQEGYKCSHSKGAAESAIEVASGKYGTDKFEKMALNANNATDPDDLNNNCLNKKTIKLVDMMDRMSADQTHGFITQTYLIAKRSFISVNFRSLLLIFRIACDIFFAIQISFLFKTPPGREDGCFSSGFHGSSSPYESRKQLIDKLDRVKMGAVVVLASLMQACTMSLLTTMLSFPFEMKIIKRELTNNWYSLNSYFIGKVLSRIPLSMLSATVLVGLVFRLTEQVNVLWRFTVFWFSIWNMSMTCENIGMLISIYFCNDILPGVLFTSLMMACSLMFAGFLIPFSMVPWFFKPLAYSSFMRHAFESLMTGLYGFERCEQGNVTRTDFLDKVIETSTPYGIVNGWLQKADTSENSLNITSAMLNVSQDHLTNIFNSTFALFEDSSFHAYSSRQPSYALTLFEIDENQFYTNLASSILILFLFKFLSYVALRRTMN